MNICSIEGCDRSGPLSRGWCTKHYTRWYIHGDPHKVLSRPKGNGWIAKGYKWMSINGKRILEHRHIMEAYLKRKLMPYEVIHHKDENGLNNDINNLVVLTKSAHALLHRDKDALKACGHKHWRKCVYCHQYDSPANMIRHDKYNRTHRACYNKYKRERKQK